MANIKIIVERSRRTEIELLQARPPRGIIARSFEDEIYGRRRTASGGGDDGGGGGGDVPAAPGLVVTGYNTYVVNSGVYTGYGPVTHYRYNTARVETSRPFAQKLQYEVSRNADYSDPHQVVELSIGAYPLGYNYFLGNRKITCTGEISLLGIRGTTQYLRARDYNGTAWSAWAAVSLVFPEDYATPPEYPLEFTESCN